MLRLNRGAGLHEAKRGKEKDETHKLGQYPSNVRSSLIVTAGVNGLVSIMFNIRM